MVQIPDLILDCSKKKPPAKAVVIRLKRFSWIY